jgi:hypothetical protein
MALHPDAGTSFSLRDFLRSTRRALGFSPMQRVLRELRRRGVDVGSLNAIELFGGCAKRHTLDYAGRVAHLEVWEIDPTCEPALHRTIPSAAIRIVDTYEEIRKTSERFDLIVVDNPMSIYGGHCEHFDLFPHILRLASDSAIIVINVIPKVSAAAQKKFPYLFNEQHLDMRRRFYEVNQADNLSPAQIVSAYERETRITDFQLEWNFWVKRHFIYYLTIKIKKVR